MRYFLLLFLPRLAIAGACCVGGGPKSFIQLKDLQSYQLGVSSSFQDSYGRYNSYGELVETKANPLYTLSFGAGIKVTDDLDATLTIPSTGAVLVGTRYLLVRSLFRDEWYPTVHLSGGLGLPAGDKGWEPYFGVSFVKDYGFAILGMNGTYTRKFQRAGNLGKEGDRFEVSETGTFPLSQRLSFILGSAQFWELARSLGSSSIADTAARGVSASLAASYYLTRYWNMSASWEFSVPLSKIGVNKDATRTFTLTSGYSFY